MARNICLGGIFILMISTTLTHTASYYSLRSQSANAARVYSGWQRFLHYPDQDKFYGSINLALEYSRTFNPSSMSKSLFANGLSGKSSCGDEITFSGSTVPNRGSHDWLADYLGLPTNYQSIVTINPMIDNVILDFSFFIGLEELLPGLFFTFHAPVVHTRWNLNFKENTITDTATTGNYPPGYFAPSEVLSKNLVKNVTAFMNEKGNQKPATNVPQLPDNMMFQELNYGRMASSCDSPLKKTGVADIRATIGYNIFNEDFYHFAIGLHMAAPTGTRPEGIYLFEPIVGNGKHWELGAQISGHYTFFMSKDEHTSAGIYTITNITHMFNARQTRSFNLCNEPNSRYMLALELVKPVNNHLQGPTGDTPTAQFLNLFSPVADISAINIKVSAAAQIDSVIACTVISHNWSIDLGYNLWFKSCDHIASRDGCTPDSLNGGSWGLKGDAFVFGYDNNTLNEPVALSATERLATIHEGTNKNLDGINSSIDNAQLAYGTFNDLMPVVQPLTNAANIQTNTSIQPRLIKETDLDFSGIKGLSNKAFLSISYAWLECEDWTPYFGIGAEVEFGHNTTSCNTPIIATAPSQDSCTTDCGTCNYCSASQWGVWVKGGFSFN